MAWSYLSSADPKDVAVVAGDQADAETMTALKDLANQLDIDDVYTDERFPKVGPGMSSLQLGCWCGA